MVVIETSTNQNWANKKQKMPGQVLYVTYILYLCGYGMLNLLLGYILGA